MKREELEALGLTKEQIDVVLDTHHKEIDPVKTELQKANDDLSAANDTIKANDTAMAELKKQLEGFKDVDVTALNETISNLEKEKQTMKADYEKSIADRDFNDLLKESITTAKGKNTKAITALLDVETLKASKNQKEDIANAIKALTEAEDSKMLFGDKEPETAGTVNLTGTVGNGANTSGDTMKSALAEYYK